jgi:signal transduction histidine kinase
VRWFARLVTDRPLNSFRGSSAPVLAPPATEDEFLADVCHRVRTPLNGILGALELLLDTDLSDDARELATAAFESARDLHRVFETELDAAVRA